MNDTKTGVAPAATTTVPPQRDWSWRHGPVIGPFNAGTGVIAAAMVGDTFGVSPWAGAALAGAGGAGMWIRSLARHVSPLGIAYRVGCMAGAGAWMSWALATTAWSPDVLGAAVAGVIAAGLAAPEMSDHEARVKSQHRREQVDAAAEAKEEAEAAERIEIAVDWETRLQEVCRLAGALVLGVQEWPGRCGYTLEVRMPPGPMTWQHLAKQTGALAGHLNLPMGCGVEVGPGATRGVCLIRVELVNTTMHEVDYPSDYSPLSLTGSLPVGMHRGGALATVELLEDPMIIVGRRGSGKTVQLQVVNLDLVRCTDAVVWHIDLNGAGMSRPWVDPWIEGQCARPAVDWVAPTVDEAVRMVRTAVAISKGRKGAYQGLMRQVNDDKIPISAQVPAIVLVVDEGAEAVALNRGNRALSSGLEELISISRASRVCLLLSGVRATGDILPAAIESQAGVRTFMRPDSAHEVAQLLGWVAGKGVELEDAPFPGTALTVKPGEAIRAMRGYLLKPAQIRDAAVQCAPRRPDLDAPSAKIGGDVYAARWDRYRAWANDLGGTTMTVPNTPEPHPKGMDAVPGLLERLAENREEMRIARERAEAGRTEPPAEVIDAAFADIVAGEDWNGTSTPETPAGPAAMLDILGRAAPAGMHWETLQAALAQRGFTVSKPTLFRWKDASGRVRLVDGKWVLDTSA